MKTAETRKATRLFETTGLLLLISSSAVFLYLIDPAKSMRGFQCPFYALSGFYCSGCGSLRSLHQLLHGNLGAAMALNPLMVLSLPFLGYAYVSFVLFGLTGRSLPEIFIKPFWIWTLLGIIVAFGILRNIPLYPFSWLAP
ncbi:MAG: DUF2752 domain-containing protein [candidate division KSB1 bacterium]|nr:DUF2752 domain-containing protein [candidate division KSB1 bacterium]MDZ7300533.1 DUF2752 domain-containing protein [candidate division KSB1 bacterium]MDZ7309672.1 DUF2752 domain-containing protein [candidate division KSB1 bacterium]